MRSDVDATRSDGDATESIGDPTAILLTGSLLSPVGHVIVRHGMSNPYSPVKASE